MKNPDRVEAAKRLKELMEHQWQQPGVRSAVRKARWRDLLPDRKTGHKNGDLKK